MYTVCKCVETSKVTHKWLLDVMYKISFSVKWSILSSAVRLQRKIQESLIVVDIAQQQSGSIPTDILCAYHAA